MKDAVVTLTAEERLRVQGIVLDRDKDDALAFLKLLLERIESAEKRGLSAPGNK